MLNFIVGLIAGSIGASLIWHYKYIKLNYEWLRYCLDIIKGGNEDADA